MLACSVFKLAKEENTRVQEEEEKRQALGKPRLAFYDEIRIQGADDVPTCRPLKLLLLRLNKVGGASFRMG